MNVLSYTVRQGGWLGDESRSTASLPLQLLCEFRVA